MIVEFWNSLSSLAYCLVAGILYFEMRKKRVRLADFEIFCLSLFLVGLGSASFHATMNWWTELLDEIPMLLTLGSFIYCLEGLHPWTSGSKRVIFLTVILACTVVGLSVYLHLTNHDVFAAVFGGLVGVSGVILSNSPLVTGGKGFLKNGKSVIQTKKMKMELLAVVGYAVAGYASWWIDQACVRLNWKNTKISSLLFWFHVFWHIFTALGALRVGKMLLKLRTMETPFIRTISGSFMKAKQL